MADALPPAPNPNALVPWVAMYTMRVRDFPLVKARGCNCLVHSESENGTVKQADWRAAARAAGLPYFDTYLGDDDVNDPWLLGWIVNGSDEWNRKRTRPRSDGTPGVEDYQPDPTPYLQLIDKLHALNAASKAAGGRWVPILANADGPTITSALFEKPPYNGLKNNERIVMRRLHGRGMDWYPCVNTASADPAEVSKRPDWLPAQALQRMQDWMDLEPDRVVPDFYFCIAEANTGSGRPVAVTPERMHAQKDYLLGRKAFPYPRLPNADGKQTVMRTLGRPPMLWVWWTANGANGPGWKWVAQSQEQADTQTAITAELLGAPAQPAPPPVVPAPPVPAPAPATAEQVAALAAKVEALTQAVDAATLAATEASQRVKGLYAGLARLAQDT